MSDSNNLSVYRTSLYLISGRVLVRDPVIVLYGGAVVDVQTLLDQCGHRGVPNRKNARAFVTQFADL